MASFTVPMKDESPQKQLMSLGEQLGTLMLLKIAVCVLLAFPSIAYLRVVTNTTSDQVGRLGSHKLSGASEGNGRDEVAHFDGNTRDKSQMVDKVERVPVVLSLGVGSSRRCGANPDTSSGSLAIDIAFRLHS